MEVVDAKKLKVGQKVMWDKNPQDKGAVVEAGWCAVRIEWDNGETGTIAMNDMGRVDLKKGGDVDEADG